MEQRKETNSDSFFDQLQPVLLGCVKYIQDKIESDWHQLQIDPSNCRREEVLTGLLVKQARLVTVLLRNPGIWINEVALILLRVMADHAILLSWLVAKGTGEDY